MTADEEKEALEGLTKQRDNLQKIMNDARGTRTELRLSNREKYNDFLQKLGELSFVFGAAIVPVVIVSHANKTIAHIPYVLIGVGIYLLNGLLAMWQTKARIEQDADDAPFIGLDEEINAYPVINALNKLLHDLSNKKYQKEYWKAADVQSWDASAEDTTSKTKVSVWLDFLLLNFVIASLLIVRAVWPYNTLSYWLVFGAIIFLLICLGVLSYIRTLNSQHKLQIKREKLKDIRVSYQKWFDDDVMKR